MRHSVVGWQLFCLVLSSILAASMTSLAALFLLWKNHRSLESLLNQSQVLIKDLTHLSAAKDLGAYQTLQQTPSTSHLSQLISQTKSSYDPNTLDEEALREQIMREIQSGQIAFDPEAAMDFGIAEFNA